MEGRTLFARADSVCPAGDFARVVAAFRIML